MLEDLHVMFEIFSLLFDFKWSLCAINENGNQACRNEKKYVGVGEFIKKCWPESLKMPRNT